MNIFVLDRDPATCAQLHNDKHVVKMCLEYSQILQGALKKQGCNVTYNFNNSQINHPTINWASKSVQHWNWVHDLALMLNEEYKYRFNHTDDHKAADALFNIVGDVQDCSGLFPDKSWEDPLGLLPWELSQLGLVEGFRVYYNRKQSDMDFDYTKRSWPTFLTIPEEQ